MACSNIFSLFKIRNGSGQLENSRIGAGRKPELLHGTLKDAHGVASEIAVFFDMAGLHLAVTEYLIFREPLQLQFARCNNPPADIMRRLSGIISGEVFVRYCRDFYMNIDPVEERPGDFSAVSLDLSGRAGAGMLRIPKISARAWVWSGLPSHMNWGR